jgi:hypothetical protein
MSVITLHFLPAASVLAIKLKIMETHFIFFSECDSGEISEQRWPLRGIPALKKFLAWTGQEATINRYRYLVCMSDI